MSAPQAGQCAGVMALGLKTSCVCPAADYMAPEVLVCPDKKRPEENKDKSLLAYGTQVGHVISFM